MFFSDNHHSLVAHIWHQEDDTTHRWFRRIVLLGLTSSILLLTARRELAMEDVMVQIQVFIVPFLGLAFGSRYAPVSVLVYVFLYILIGALPSGYEQVTKLATFNPVESTAFSPIELTTFNISVGYFLGLFVASCIVGKMGDATHSQKIPYALLGMSLGVIIIRGFDLLWHWVVSIVLQTDLAVDPTKFISGDLLIIVFGGISIPFLWRLTTA